MLRFKNLKTRTIQNENSKTQNETLWCPDVNTYGDVLLSGSGGVGGETTGTLTPTHNRVLLCRPGEGRGVLDLDELDLEVVEGLLQEVLLSPEPAELVLDFANILPEGIRRLGRLIQEHRHLLVELAEHLDDGVPGNKVRVRSGAS